MTSFDRLLQQWRGAKVRPYLGPKSRLLDIGCGDGALFQQHRGCFGEGIGVEPDLNGEIRMDSCRLISGWFPEAVRGEQPFDVITMLAVLEHIPPQEQQTLAAHIQRWLKVGGHLIVTVPSPQVDLILAVLRKLRIVHGMALEQHYGFEPGRTPDIFEPAGLRLVRRRRFQLGLNNLYVFQRCA